MYQWLKIHWLLSYCVKFVQTTLFFMCRQFTTHISCEWMAYMVTCAFEGLVEKAPVNGTKSIY